MVNLTKNSAPDLSWQEWAYTGVIFGSDKKLYERWVPVSRINMDKGIEAGEKAHSLFKADKKMRVVGAVYELEASADCTKAKTGSAKYKYVLPAVKKTPELVLQWKVRHEAARTEYAALATQKRLKDSALVPLEPLRRLYAETPYPQRAALELTVLKYLRSAG